VLGVFAVNAFENLFTAEDAEVAEIAHGKAKLKPPTRETKIQD
jgi:hypothetical protein